VKENGTSDTSASALLISERVISLLPKLDKNKKKKEAAGVTAAAMAEQRRVDKEIAALQKFLGRDQKASCVAP